MPERRLERTRANYHHIQAAMTESPHTYEHILSIRISRMSIASWSSPRALRDRLMQTIYNKFEAILPR